MDFNVWELVFWNWCVGVSVRELVCRIYCVGVNVWELVFGS